MAHKSSILVALLSGVLTLLLLLATAGPIGLTWDEPAYIAASELYIEWFDQLRHSPGYALSEAGIRTYWDINHEHPPLNKIWSGLIWMLSRGVLDDLTAHRLGNMLLVGLLAAMLCYSVGRSYGPWAGIAAVLALLSMPRFFFHAHLAALDVPGAVAFFGITALFWHTRERRHIAWDLLLALAWGAGLATKINAAFVLPTLGLWLLAAWRLPRGVAFGRMLRRLLLMTIGGPLVFVALWPWLYHDTVARIDGYIRFITVDHWQIGQWYLGEFFMPPPWHFPFVMAVAVTPLLIFGLALVGLWRGLRSMQPGAPVVLWMCGAIMPLLALTTGRTMVYDNERLFMPFFPYLAALAGVGIVAVGQYGAQWLAARGAAVLARGALPLLLLAALLPQSIAAVRLFPHTLSYYSAVVGGLPGAVRLGLETTYWCEVYAAALPLINAETPPGAVIWAEPWSHDVLLYYQLQGRLRPDLRVALTRGAGSILAFKGAAGLEADIGESDYVIVAQRETGLHVNPQITAWAANRTPILVLERDGVRLMALYAAGA
ncbi:MAG TPA: glycosyltransferase family 39 protein [Roseiflexaceae bacterium]|nr:glycosyltransferase family 39 protein [Roseiflexaceae bacterium]